MTKKRDELLSHDADGIREFDNALPRWWLYGFYFTIVFAGVYLVNYHLLFHPWFGRPSILSEYRAEMVAARLNAAPPPHGPTPVAATVPTDRDSLQKGSEIFHSARSQCMSCHRDDLGGVIGPNLTDDKWLHGCSADALVRTITIGVPDKGMMPFGTGQYLSPDEVLQLVSYVLSKRGSNPSNPKPPDPVRDKDCNL
jgi:cytochrome c oxidase cbb3-type subunit 3